MACDSRCESDALRVVSGVAVGLNIDHCFRFVSTPCRLSTLEWQFSLARAVQGLVMIQRDHVTTVRPGRPLSRAGR